MGICVCQGEFKGVLGWRDNFGYLQFMDDIAWEY